MNENIYNVERLETRVATIVSPPDKTLLITVLILIGTGLLSVFSTSIPKCIEDGQPLLKYFLSQLAFAFIGLWGMMVISKIDYKKLFPFAVFTALAVIILLALVKFTPLGMTVNGAKRWIGYGSFSFQPSELSKFAVILLMGNAFYRNTQVFVQNKMIYFSLILIILFMIFQQPNLSMVLLLLMTVAAMYICSGAPLKALVWIGAIAGALLLWKGLPILMEPYQMTRIATWLNPDADTTGASYNIVQSLTALASGGIFGNGFGASKMKLGWLPECHTDFIFAIIGEEFGFVGGLLVLCLFWTFIRRGIMIAVKSPDMYGRLLAIGITFSIGMQGLLNICVATSFLPATGVTMPFISYGGSSLMVSLWMVGVLLSISRMQIRKIRVPAENNSRYR